MTAFQYLRQSGVTASEIMALVKQSNQDYQDLLRYAREEMTNKGIPIEEPQSK
jgi:hypothetical protein